MGQVPDGKCDCVTQRRSHRISWKMGRVHIAPWRGARKKQWTFSYKNPESSKQPINSMQTESENGPFYVP